MPINMMSMVVGFTMATNRGVPRQEALTFGAVSSFLPTTPISLIVIDKLAENRAAELAPAPSPPKVKVISVVGALPGEAASTLREASLTPEFKFAADLVVIDQSPKPTAEGDEGVDAGATVTLSVDRGTIA